MSQILLPIAKKSQICVHVGMNGIKNKLYEEMRELLFLTGYLTLFLTSLSIYRSLVLQTNFLNFFHLGYNFLEALILAKIILLGKILKIGDRYSDRSLLIPTLYKAGAFSIFVFLFTGLEHYILGLFKGHSLEMIWRGFIEKGFNENVGRFIIAFLFFILLFSFLELASVVGEDKVFKLFLRRNKK